MPSGAKKRKAAKKKKQKENNINPQGNDELKSQDEKGSDGSEGNSPQHCDHDDHHHPFNEGGEELEAVQPSAAQPSASNVKPMKEVPIDIQIDEVVGGNEDGVVMIEMDLKSKESSQSKNVSFEHIETAKESYYGNRNAFGTSNHESLTGNNSKHDNHSSIEEVIACHELVKVNDSSPSKVTLITENATVEETGNADMESSFKSVKTMASLSEVENGDTGSALLVKSNVCFLDATDFAVHINGDNVHPIADENARASSLEAPKPNDGEVLAPPLSASPLTKFTNGAEHVKDCESPGCSENQPLAASAPHMVQKISWLSCCGLFEVLSGFNKKYQHEDLKRWVKHAMT